MKNNFFKLSVLSVATSLAITLTGCGGGSDSGEVSAAYTPVEATGQFIDAPVGNLDVYQNDKKVDTTDSEGMFTYMPGSEVTFKLGELTLGSTMPKDIITPADLSAVTDNVIEILQALQSLDEDNNPDNGIFIAQTTIDKLVTALDLSKDDVSIADTIKKDIPDLVLVGIEDALAHFSMAQETVKTSTDLSQIANQFVGYWQQSCDDGNQQVIQLAKDSVSPNVLYQTGQYINRKYANANCTGSYNETIEYSDTDPVTLAIMGTILDENGKQVLHTLRTEGVDVFLNSLEMLSADSFLGGELMFSRIDSLAFALDNNIPKPKIFDDLVGYWQSTCEASSNGSKQYYLDIMQEVGMEMIIKNAYRENFASDDCTGSSNIIINEDSHNSFIPESDVYKITFNGDNQFVAGEDTLETYNRITQSEFAAVSDNVDVNVEIDTVEQTVNTMVGYWESNCLQYGDTSEIAYIKINKINGTTIQSDPIIIKEYDNNSCAGTPVGMFQDKSDTVDFNQEQEDIPTFNGNNQLIVTYEEDGNQMQETYNRITQSEFAAVR